MFYFVVLRCHAQCRRKSYSLIDLRRSDNAMFTNRSHSSPLGNGLFNYSNFTQDSSCSNLPALLQSPVQDHRELVCQRDLLHWLPGELDGRAGRLAGQGHAHADQLLPRLSRHCRYPPPHIRPTSNPDRVLHRRRPVDLRSGRLFHDGVLPVPWGQRVIAFDHRFHGGTIHRHMSPDPIPDHMYSQSGDEDHPGTVEFRDSVLRALAGT